MNRRLLWGIVALALNGCATYEIALMPRSAGSIAHGHAKQIDKSVVVTIGNETYTGHYVYMQGGSFTLGTVFAGGQVATGTAMGVSAVGNGNVLADSPDGHNLRCVFSFSGWSQQGTGVCMTDDGQLYDMQITR